MVWLVHRLAVNVLAMTTDKRLQFGSYLLLFPKSVCVEGKTTQNHRLTGVCYPVLVMLPVNIIRSPCGVEVSTNSVTHTICCAVVTLTL